MNWKRTITGVGVTLVAAAGLLLATAAPAGADPPFRSVTIHCNTLGDLEIVAEGNGEWVHAAIPLHVVDSNQVLLLYKYHYVGIPSDGGPPIVVEGEKPAPQSGRLDTCQWTETFPEGTVFTTIGVSYTPA